MAAVGKREPVVILRIDGEDLKEFVDSIQFESVVNSIFSSMESANASLRMSITMALEQLTIEHGMPPSSDSWVFGNIVEPALQSLSMNQLEQPVSQEIFLKEFKKLVSIIILSLQEHPVIVAHSENTYDGSGIKRLLSNKFELNKVDAIVNEVFRMVNADDRMTMQEEVFKKTMTEILESLMLQLEENPILFSSNSVVHEPLASSSALDPSSPSSGSSQGESIN